VRQRFVLAALVPVVVALGGIGTASAAPTAGDTPVNHGQCVKESPQPTGKGGRSAAAKSKVPCTPPTPLTCIENEDTPGTVTRDSANNTVTISGSGGTPEEPSAGSSFECATDIAVTAGQTISFSYTLGAGTSPCGGGVPRVFVLFADGTTSENTVDIDPQCENSPPGTVTYTLANSGTITTVGFVYDRQDLGSVTYSNATVGGVTLDV
jgi:hypothetical protein